MASVGAAGGGGGPALAPPPRRLGRSRSVDGNLGSQLVGQRTELWSGGGMVNGEYKSLEERAGDDATRRFGHTLEMGFGNEQGFNDYGPIRGEVRQTLAPWDNNDASTQAPWLDLSSQLAHDARGKVHATVHPNRTAGLLAPAARDGAGPVVAGQQDRGGVFWQREWPELGRNPNVSSLQMTNAESGDNIYVPRSGRGAWEAPDVTRGNS